MRCNQICSGHRPTTHRGSNSDKLLARPKRLNALCCGQAEPPVLRPVLWSRYANSVLRSRPDRPSRVVDCPRHAQLVVFLADDLGSGDMSVYGSSDERTPNLERLASLGMTFIDAFIASRARALSRPDPLAAACERDYTGFASQTSSSKQTL